MTSADGLAWGTGWSVPGWEQPGPASDWAAWQRARGMADGGGSDGGKTDGDGARTTADGLDAPAVAEHLDALVDEGISALRVPLDWARLAPENGKHDPDAVEHLRAALVLVRDRGFATWGCVHHGPLPGWFAHDERGFADARARRYHWARHVEMVGEWVGDLVDGWIPVVEPTRWAKRAWLDGSRPPGRVDDGGAFTRHLEGVQLASVEAALRLRESGRPVASAQWAVPVFPARDDLRLPPTPEAEVAADEVDEVLWRSWLRMIDEETLVVPGRPPISVPGARQAFDVVGITYRHAVAVAADRSWAPYPQALATGADGHVPWSEGLALSLHRLADAVPGRNLMAVDVGIGLSDPEPRAHYLSEIRDLAVELAEGGVPLIGCFTPAH